ncbi:hypothetical protein [Flavobacterium araucananum]|nr:hypothetical protein [Flavobacterium araucananum]
MMKVNSIKYSKNIVALLHQPSEKIRAITSTYRLSLLEFKLSVSA